MIGNDAENRGTSWVIRFFFWIMGGLSVLNLIRDARALELYGLLREWVDAYRALVDKVCGFLFGWIDWSWIKIDEAENHVIVIAALLGGLVGRASGTTGRVDRDTAALNVALWMGILLALFVTLMLLLPSPWGMRIGLVLEALLLAMWTAFHDNPRWRRMMIRELLVVLSAFTLIVVANYVIFKP